jgi:hypothetical protein
MATYPTKLLEVFASQALEIFYAKSISEVLCNNDWEGQLADKGSILNVLTFGALDWSTYTGADMTASSLTESNAQLITDQAKYSYFTVKDYDKFRSYIKNPEGPAQRQLASRLQQLIDIFVLGFYGDVGAGNRSGTDYTTGTVTVDVTTGAVTGSNTTFTTAMVGKPFKATGHTSWYRVKSFASTTSIVIEDDLDDVASVYTGGAIGGGATYTIQANTAIQVTKDTIFAKVNALATLLTNAEVPTDNRNLPVPASIATLIKQSPEYLASGTESGRQKVLDGQLDKMFAGFNVYEVPDGRFTGDSVNGWHIVGGHKSALCFAMGLTENGEEPAIGNFGKRFKSLVVYGAKVPDERRKALVEGYWKL